MNSNIVARFAIVIAGMLAISLPVGAQETSPNAGGQKAAAAKGTIVSEICKDPWHVFQDKKNNYWFGSHTQGVYRYDGKVIVHFTTKDGLCNDSISGIQEDKSGNIYFNTAKGVSKFDGQIFTTLNVEKNNSANAGWKLQADDLWFPGGQDSGAVYRYDGKSLHRLEFPKTKRGDEHYERTPRSKFPNAKYSPYDVYTIYLDRKGSLWFGTAELGACRYDGKSFDWLYENHLTNTPGGGSFGIRSILEDRDGKFWICNTQFRFNIDPDNSITKEKGLVDYKREPGVGDLKARIGESYLYFQSIVADNQQDLWMAPYAGGVWRYDGKSITHYPVKVGSKDITMFSIYKDNRGDLWLGTHEEGVYKFNGKTFEKFKP